MPPHLSSTGRSQARPSSSAWSWRSAAGCCQRTEGRMEPVAARRVRTRGAAPVCLLQGSCPRPRPAVAPREEVAEGEAEGAEEVVEDPLTEQMGEQRGGAARGREVKRPGFRGRPWAETWRRSRRRRAEEEPRGGGGRRCSRSERRLPACSAAAPPSSDCDPDSDAAGWTSGSPGPGSAVWGTNRVSRGDSSEEVVERDITLRRVSPD